MNYYQPRQIKNSGKWHYTNMNDGRVYPVGFCAQDCPGHDTEEDAYAHQKEYVMSTLDIRGPKDTKWPKEKCAVQDCEEEGTHCAHLAGNYVPFDLCPKHANKETVETLLEIGDSIES